MKFNLKKLSDYKLKYHYMGFLLNYQEINFAIFLFYEYIDGFTLISTRFYFFLTHLLAFNKMLIVFIKIKSLIIFQSMNNS